MFDAAAGFGGYKQSGYGRDGGKEGLYEYVKPVWQSRIRVKDLDMDLKKFGSAYIADGPGINGSNGEPKNDQVGVFISFSRKSDSTILNVLPSVCPSDIKTPQPFRFICLCLRISESQLSIGHHA